MSTYEERALKLKQFLLIHLDQEIDNIFSSKDEFLNSFYRFNQDDNELVLGLFSLTNKQRDWFFHNVIHLIMEDFVFLWDATNILSTSIVFNFEKLDFGVLNYFLSENPLKPTSTIRTNIIVSEMSDDSDSA